MDLDKVCKRISKDLNIDYETTRRVVLYQFKFTVDTMKDENDYHDILFNKLFKFKLKTRFKENKSKEYSSK